MRVEESLAIGRMAHVLTGDEPRPAVEKLLDNEIIGVGEELIFRLGVRVG